METKEWITLVGILTSLGVGFYSLWISKANAKKTAFINSVTTSRMKWIETLRKNIADFCGLLYSYSLTALSEDEKKKLIMEVDKLRFLIKLQLNPSDKLDKQIINLINDLPNLTDPKKNPQMELSISNLTELTQKLLKFEWERVKLESEKGILSSEDKDALLKKLEEQLEAGKHD